MADGAPHPAPRLDEAALLARITIEPDKMHGRPCIRGLRVRVIDVLAMIACGMSAEDVIEDYPYLEPDDLRAAALYAAVALDDHKPDPATALA